MASTDRDLSQSQELLRRRSRSFTEVHGNPHRIMRPVQKSETPIQQPASAISVDTMYQHLQLAIAERPVALKIPETLLISEAGQDVLLFTDERGTIAQSTESNPLSHFLQLCSLKQTDLQCGLLSEFPLYIFYTSSSSFKVLFAPAEAEKVWSASRDHTKLLQRYIPPHSREPCKTRMIWSRTGDLRRYHIKKRGIESILQTLRSRPRNPTGSPKASYTYASRLKRESFSPYLPYKSVLEVKEESREAEQVSPIRTENSYVVFSSCEGSYQWEVISTPLVQPERFLPVAKDIIMRFVARDDEVIHELAYDVLKDIYDQYYFLNAKWVCCGPPDESPHTPSFGRKAASSLRQKFSSLMATKVPDKIPFIDMHEIQAQNVKLYMSRFSSMAASPSTSVPQSPKPAPKAELEHANLQLDSLTQSATILRQREEENQRVRLQSYQNEKLLDAVIARVYGKVTIDPLLQQFFSNMNKREMNMLKLGFSKAFTGVDNYYFKRTVKKVHEGLGIDKKQFEKFVETFMVSMQEEGVRQCDIDTVCCHLNRFADEVIEDDM